MIDKSKNNKARLAEIREIVNHSSDDQLAQAMKEEWENGFIPDELVDEEDIQRIKRHIHAKIDKRRFTTKHMLRWMQIAAAIMLPICLAVMGFMYHENKKYASIPMSKIATQLGEQVSVTLPDGTLVALNSLSELRYAAQDFCQANREVDFDGEAHYTVSKDASHPFIIHMAGMEIKVLGTEFNVINRKRESTAVVALINGSVKLTSFANGSTYTMQPNEVVTVNKQTGNMDIKRMENIQETCAWQQKQMIYHDASFYKVVKDLERQYGIHIVNKAKTKENFTGTLPTNNLDEAMKILSVSYELKISKTKTDTYTFK